MSIWFILHIVDVLLWSILAVSVCYVLVFSVASSLPCGRRTSKTSSEQQSSTFLVLIPAYHEDKVIHSSVSHILRQDYPSENYCVVVISDHMQPDTNQWLSSQPITLLLPTFEKSSKAKALQYAVDEMQSRGKNFDRVVILDADNVVQPDFLVRLNAVLVDGSHAVQCHRTAKNSENDIAVLDGVSEEINNSIFRRGHNRLGLSSALIGSGMCFDYAWFCEYVWHLDSAVEDRELEALLLSQRVFIRYEEDIRVMDEKVSSTDNFTRQRSRWLNGQFQTLVIMMSYLPQAVIQGNINYIDKTVQQALVPRSILLVLTVLIAVITLLFARDWTLKWWLMLAVLVLSLLLAIPRQFLRRVSPSTLLMMLKLACRMLGNLMHVSLTNKDFTHTTHNK